MGKQSRAQREARAAKFLPRRTKLSLMAEILATATGRPIESTVADLIAIKSARGMPGDGPMTEQEYQAERASLMTELPGILAWMVQGAVEAYADPNFLDRMVEVRRAASSRN